MARKNEHSDLSPDSTDPDQISIPGAHADLLNLVSKLQRTRDRQKATLDATEAQLRTLTAIVRQ